MQLLLPCLSRVQPYLCPLLIFIVVHYYFVFFVCYYCFFIDILYSFFVFIVAYFYFVFVVIFFCSISFCLCLKNKKQNKTIEKKEND